MSRLPVAFRLPAIRFLAILCPLGTWASLTRPDPIGIVTLRTYEIRPGWVPSIPRGLRYPHDQRDIASRRTPPSNGRSLHPGTTSHHPRSGLTRHQRGFTYVHPSGLPLACDHRMERQPLGFSLELHTPPLPATHVEVGTGIRYLPELCHYSRIVLLPA
jgi:hypothetical protein